MTTPAVAPPPALDTPELSESTRGTASGESDLPSPEPVLAGAGDVVLDTTDVALDEVGTVDVLEVVVVVEVVVEVVDGGVGGLVVEACTVTLIVAKTFLPLFLEPPQTYSSTSHLPERRD